MHLAGEHLKRQIREEALRLGFADLGFSRATQLEGDAERLQAWLDAGLHAGMGYMAKHFEKRTHPARLVEGALTVVSLLYNYKPAEPVLSERFPKISRYAYGQDYHDVLRAKLNALFDFIKRDLYPQLEGRVFVDSAPLLERSLAARAGLGWIGKNSLLIHRKLGSYVFLSELVLNLDLPTEDAPAYTDRCGGCTLCIDACPTTAILPGRTVDAGRCLSYLTIENKAADIPEEFAGKTEGWTFGCDICQEVCPWNRRPGAHNEPAFVPSAELLAMDVDRWRSMEQADFSRLFKGSAVKRAKFSGWQRNFAFAERRQGD